MNIKDVTPTCFGTSILSSGSTIRMLIGKQIKVDENCGHTFTSFQTTAHRLTVQNTIWHYAVTLFPFPTALYMDVPWKFCLTCGGYSLTYFEWKMLYQRGSKCEPSYHQSEQIARTSTRRTKSLVPFVPIPFLASGSYAVCRNTLFVLCFSVHENQFTEDDYFYRHHHE